MQPISLPKLTKIALVLNFAFILIISTITVVLFLYFQILSIYFIIPSNVAVVFLLVNIIILCFIHSHAVKYTSKVSNIDEKYSARTTAYIENTSITPLKSAKSASQVNIDMTVGLPNNEHAHDLPPIRVIQKSLTDLASDISASHSEGTKHSLQQFSASKVLEEARILAQALSESEPIPLSNNIVQVTKKQRASHVDKWFALHHPSQQHEQVDTESMSDMKINFPENMTSMIVGNIDTSNMPAIAGSLYMSGHREEDPLVDASPINIGKSIISTDDDCEELYEPGDGETTPRKSISNR